MQDGFIRSIGAARSLRVGVSAAVLAALLVQPTLAASKDPVLDACQAERAPLVEQDKSYKELKRSKLGAAVGEGIKKGATVIAAGVLSGGIPIGGRGGGGFRAGLGGFNPVGGVMNMAAGAAAQRQAAAAGAPVQATPVAYFGPDIISGAGGLNVPGLGGYSAGGDGKAYAALAVLVAIVGTIDAYARLKEQEAGGDLSKAAYNIDQDAARQLTVSRELANNATALADCRTRQLTDINSRLASASNDKDRKAITRERTQYVGALEKDIDLTGGLVNEHTGMAKTFTQGRAMAGGVSEAEVLGPQAPAYAPSASSDRLAMPKGSGAQVTQANYAPGAAAAPAAAPASDMVTLRATVVRQAPVASSDQVMSLPAGRTVKPKAAQPEGGWYEIDVAGAPGYIRASDLGPPGSAAAPTQTAAAGKGKAAGKGGAAAKPAEPAPAPQLASASNIRAYNGSVIAARDNGKGRLSSLMTDIKTSQRQSPTLWASLLSRWLG